MCMNCIYNYMPLCENAFHNNCLLMFVASECKFLGPDYVNILLIHLLRNVCGFGVQIQNNVFAMESAREKLFSLPK